MKKIFMLLLCAVSLVSFTACSNLPFGVGGLGKNAKNESGENPSDYEVTVDNAYSMNAGGKNYILVEADFKNNSEENKSFNDIYNMQAFQDGVELHQNNSWTCTKFDLKKCASKLQPGCDTKVYIGFETSDITKDVSVECKSLISGDDTSNDVKSLLSVNSSNYEKPTQTTTQATTQAQAQAPQQKVVVVHDNAPAPSNNGGYVCLGLSMNEAYNLMTPSEKAIVANNANDRALVNEQYAKHGYCFSKDYWHNYFYGYTH